MCIYLGRVRSTIGSGIGHIVNHQLGHLCRSITYKLSIALILIAPQLSVDRQLVVVESILVQPRILLTCLLLDAQFSILFLVESLKQREQFDPFSSVLHDFFG